MQLHADWPLVLCIFLRFLPYVFRACGEAMFGTQRYFSKELRGSFCSRLQRDDFKYTTIKFRGTCDSSVRASSYAVLGTQGYFST